MQCFQVPFWILVESLKDWRILDWWQKPLIGKRFAFQSSVLYVLILSIMKKRARKRDLSYKNIWVFPYDPSSFVIEFDKCSRMILCEGNESLPSIASTITLLWRFSEKVRRRIIERKVMNHYVWLIKYESYRINHITCKYTYSSEKVTSGLTDLVYWQIHMYLNRLSIGLPYPTDIQVYSGIFPRTNVIIRLNQRTMK